MGEVNIGDSRWRNMPTKDVRGSDVPQPICKIDGEVELSGVSCDRAPSKGGMRTASETSQPKD